MKRRSMIVGMAALVAGVASVFAAPAMAAYPEKPITVICPWSPGGGTDVLLRALSKEAEKFLGQTINVVNQTGGAGAIGHNAIRAARPDGYTLGMITFELNSLPPQGLIPFDYKAFDPLMRVNADPAALTVRKDAPYNTVRGFVDYAKAHPDEITIGNSAPGSVWHIAAGLVAEKAGIQVKHVPFDGAAPAVTSLVGGHIKGVAVSVAEVRGQVQAGNLKLLGVMDTARDPLFPDVPTFREQGIDVQFYTWRGMATPKGVPAPIKAKLSDAFSKAMQTQEFKDFLKKAGLNPAYLNAAEFSTFLEKNAQDVRVVMEGLGLAKK